MALRPVGVKFVTKGFSQFQKQLRTVDRTYRTLGKSINLTGNNITAFGAKLRVFNRGGTAYSQWVDEATGSFLKHTEVQDRFQNSILASQGVLANFGKSFNVVSLSKFNIILGVITASISLLVLGFKGWKKVIEGTIAVVKAAISPFIKLGQAMAGLAVSVGRFLVGDLINAVQSTFSTLRSEIVSTVSDFQRLEIQYESLIARQLRLADGTLSVEASLAQAAGRAQELLEWVKQIAITTPFEVETIARTLAFSQAMGFTTKESQAVTTAIINFTSAMGLGQETMERIIQNFGQMRAAGKVTGTELRDLARGALVPVNDILTRMGENLGIAKENMADFRKAAAEGAAPVDEFFKAFIDVANESFPNAAERMSRTFEGVKNNIVDFFKTVVGVEALGPLFDRVTEIMANALDSLLSPAVRRVAKVVGETLLQGFNQVWDAIQNKLLPALKNLAAAFGFTEATGFGFAEAIARISATISVAIEKVSEFINEIANNLNISFDDLAEKARGWGENIIGSLAEGMAAAAKFVVDVLIKLGNIIAGWLEAKSPPKLLPNLGRWGAAAMTEYMKGWLKADFSVFDSIASTVESFIRSISGTIISEKNVVPTILKIRDALAKAMNDIAKSGDVTKKNLNAVFAALRGGTPELRAYVELQIKLAKADAAVKKAQDELNAVTAKYERILGPLRQRLDEITDRSDEFDNLRRIAVLQLILTDINASAGDKERARLEIERLRLENQIAGLENEQEAEEALAQEKLTAAEIARDAVAEELAAKEALIKVQIDTNNLIKEQIDLLERLKKSAGGLAAAFGGIGGFGDEDPEKRGSGGALNTFKDRISKIFSEMRTNVEESIDGILGKFGDFQDGLTELNTVWGRISGSFSDSRLVEAVKRAGDVVGASTINFTDMVTALGNLLTIDFGGISGGFAGIAIIFTESTFLGSMAIFNGLMEATKEIFDGLSERIDNVVKAMFDLVNIENFQEFVIDLQNLYLAVSDLTAGIPLFWEAITGFWSGYQDVVAAARGENELKMSGIKDDTIAKFEEMEDEITGSKGSIMPRMIDEMQTEVETGAVSMSGTFENLVNGDDGIIKKFEKLYTKLVGESIVPDLVTEIVANFQSLYDRLVGPEGLFTLTMSTMLTQAETTAARMYQKGLDIIQGLWDGVKEKWEELKKWVEDNFPWLIDILETIYDMTSPSKAMIERGINIMRGLGIGLEEGRKDVTRTMEKIAATITSPFGDNDFSSDNRVKINIDFESASTDWIDTVKDTVSEIATMFDDLVNVGNEFTKSLIRGLDSAALHSAQILSNLSVDVVSAAPVASSQTTNIVNNNYNLTMPTTASPAGVQRGFNVMALMNS